MPPLRSLGLGAPLFYKDTEEIPQQINPTGFRRFLKSSRFPRRIRLGCKPNLLGRGRRRLFFLKLTLMMVRLGMHVANVKLRQILPRVGKIWASTLQN